MARGSAAHVSGAPRRLGHGTPEFSPATCVPWVNARRDGVVATAEPGFEAAGRDLTPRLEAVVAAVGRSRGPVLPPPRAELDHRRVPSPVPHLCCTDLPPPPPDLYVGCPDLAGPPSDLTDHVAAGRRERGDGRRGEWSGWRDSNEDWGERQTDRREGVIKKLKRRDRRYVIRDSYLYGCT
jgi:hypothetical protein